MIRLLLARITPSCVPASRAGANEDDIETGRLRGERAEAIALVDELHPDVVLMISRCRFSTAWKRHAESSRLTTTTSGRGADSLADRDQIMAALDAGASDTCERRARGDHPRNPLRRPRRGTAGTGRSPRGAMRTRRRRPAAGPVEARRDVLRSSRGASEQVIAPSSRSARRPSSSPDPHLPAHRRQRPHGSRTLAQRNSVT